MSVKHEPNITSLTAHCSCGRMPGVLRGVHEPQGAFTVRAWECHRIHVELAKAERPVQAGLFEVQTDLFA
jgi:hypothetical protein